MSLLSDAFAAYMGELIDGKLIADSSPNGHHAVFEGEIGVPTWQASGGPGDRPYLEGPGGTSAGFNRNGVGVAPYWPVGTSNFSIALWATVDAANTRIYGTRNFSGRGITLSLDGNGRLEMLVHGDAGAVTHRTTTPFALGVWRSYVIEFDRTAETFRAEVDGAVQSWFSPGNSTAGQGSLSGTREHTHLAGHRREKSTSDPDFHEMSLDGGLTSVLLIPRLLTAQERSDLADPDYYPTSGRFSGGGGFTGIGRGGIR